MTQITLTSWCNVATMNDLHRTSFYPRAHLSVFTAEATEARSGGDRTNHGRDSFLRHKQLSRQPGQILRKLKPYAWSNRLFSAASPATKGGVPPREQVLNGEGGTSLTAIVMSANQGADEAQSPDIPRLLDLVK